MRKIVPTNAMLIPEDASQVFAGEIYDVYQWPQKLFDGSSATYEMLKRPDTMQIIAIKKNKIIVLDEQQSGRPSYLRLPGGRVEPGEDWLAAAKRETSEELGMRFSNWRLINVRQPIVKIEWFVATYLATDFLDEKMPKRDAGEKISVLELPLDEWKDRLSKESSPLADYAKLAFLPFQSLDQITQLPEFKGKEVNR